MSETLGCGHPDKNRACGDCLEEAEAENEKLRAHLKEAHALGAEAKRGWDDAAAGWRNALLQLRELQERYDIYAEHLKTCVVWIAPEIPCDCGFLTTTQKRIAPAPISNHPLGCRCLDGKHGTSLGG